MITKAKQKRSSTMMDRARIMGHYITKYFNLFLNRFRFEGDLSDEAIDFFMRQFWQVGTVACFKLDGTEGSSDHPEGLLVFTPYAPTRYNLYNHPVEVTLVALRGATFVPRTPQVVNEQVVVGWIQRNHEGAYPIVRYYAERIASVEMVLQVNLNAQKYPWLIGTSPEGAGKARQLAELLLEDNPTLFVELDEVDKAKALVSGAPYIIDKLYNYKNSLENELREYLSLTNLGVGEKKEHLLVDEIASNDEVTAASGDVFLDCLTEFFDRVREYLGVNVKVSLNDPEPPSEPMEETKDEEEENTNA